jgi:cell division protein FtsX
VEEDIEGERIEDQLLALREQLMQLSANAQKLNSAPINEQLPVTVEVRPQPAICAASTTHIQTVLQVNYCCSKTS